MQTGRDNLVHIAKLLIKGGKLSIITTETLQKMLYLLSIYYDRKVKELKERESTQKSADSNNETLALNLNNNINSLKYIIKNLNKELLNEERKVQINTNNSILNINLNVARLNNNENNSKPFNIKKLSPFIDQQDAAKQQTEDKESYIKKFKDNLKSVSYEALAHDLGPTYIQLIKKEYQSKSGKNSTDPETYTIINNLNFNLTEERLANIVTFIIKEPNFSEEKEHRLLLKMLFRNISIDSYNSIDETNDKKQSIYWNIDSLYKFNKNSIENMDSNLYYSLLDNKYFKITDKRALESFILIHSKLKLPNLLFKYLLKEPWENTNNQIDTLKFLLNNQNDLTTSGKKIKKTNNYDLSLMIKSNSANSTNDTYFYDLWTNLELIEGLIRIGVNNNVYKVKSLFEWPLINMPEILLLSLFQCNKNDFLYKELLKDLYPILISNQPNSNLLLDDIWTINQNRVIEVVIWLHNTFPETFNISKILDISLKMKDSLLILVNNNHSLFFSISLAILAIKRDFLHINQWLNDQIDKNGELFINALLCFIEDNLLNEYRTKINQYINNSNTISSSNNINSGKILNTANNSNSQNLTISKNNQNLQQDQDFTYLNIRDQILEKSQLTLESIVIIFETINQYINNSENNSNIKLSSSLTKSVSAIYKQIFLIFEELQIEPVTSEETEALANMLFKKLFNEELTISDMAQQMKNFKENSNKKEQEVFACMLHSMLDEYRFFNKYPEKELNLMGGLFGKIVDIKIIDGVIESIVLKLILDGFKLGGKMIVFSTKATEQFINRIMEWPLLLEELYKNTSNLIGQGEIFDIIADKYTEFLKINENSGVNFNSNILGASSTNYNLNTNPNVNLMNQSKINQSNNYNNYMNMVNINSTTSNNTNSINNINNNNAMSINNPNPNLNLSKNQKNNKFNSNNDTLNNLNTNFNLANNSNNNNNSNTIQTNPNYSNSYQLSVNNASNNITSNSNQNNSVNKTLSLNNNSYIPSYIPNKNILNTNLNPYNINSAKKNVENSNNINKLPQTINQNNNINILSSSKNLVGPNNDNIDNTSNINLNISTENINSNSNNNQPNANSSNIANNTNVNLLNKNNNINSINLNNVNLYQPNAKKYFVNNNNNNPTSTNTTLNLPNNQHNINYNIPSNYHNAYYPTNIPYNNIYMYGHIPYGIYNHNPNDISNPNFNVNNKSNNIYIPSNNINIKQNELYERFNSIFFKLNSNTIVDCSLEVKYIINIDENSLVVFSYYLTTKRIPYEKDNVNIYYDMLSVIDQKTLYKKLIGDCVCFCNNFFTTKSEIDNSKKSALKNLGYWLGLLTLKRHRPLFSKEINLKDIIIKGFESGKLLTYISFTAKVLESAVNNKIFNKNNPWIMSLFSLLAEIYINTRISQNIKFEIQILFKKFNLEPDSYIIVKTYTDKLVIPNSVDFNNNNNKALKSNVNNIQESNYNLKSTLKRSNVNSSGIYDKNNIYNDNTNISLKKNMQASYEDISSLLENKDVYIKDVVNYINKYITQKNSKTNSNSLLVQFDVIKNILCNSLVSSINQILCLVVERTVNISLITTRELIKKDFIFEPDANKLKTAANNTIKSLSCSLATVTCKDPLKLGFNNCVKEEILRNEIDFSEEYINKLSEHLGGIIEAGCFFIQNFVVNIAIDKIENDEYIKKEIENRLKDKHKEFINYKSSITLKVLQLPENLRPNINGLNCDQYKIYEDFEKININQSNHELNANNRTSNTNNSNKYKQ